MIESWSDFVSVFALGLSCGLVVGFTCLGVRFVTRSLRGWFSAATRIW